ncbi:MAG: GerAB/ArcD/ProY family transporter [Oscillospiraceae bacterium]|nr:GerAB/ArcD/ProY family transporter [Oscillospiraceae bacterium]
MTNEFPKISAGQLFCALIMSRIAIEVISPNSSTAPKEAILSIIITELIRFLLALPLIVFSFKHDNFHRHLYNKNKFLGWTSAAFGALLLIGAAVKTLFHTIGFAEKNLLIGTSSWIIFAAAAIFAVYAAFMGIEAAARSGALFLAAAGIITVIVFVADIPYFRTSEIWNVSDNGTLLSDVITRFLNGGEYLLFAAFLPYINKKHTDSSGKTAMYFMLFSIVIPTVMCILNFLVLREFYGLTEYPSAASASLSDISLFKRLDGIFSAIWAMCAALRCGLFLLSAVLVFIAVKRISYQESQGSEKTPNAAQ